MKHIYFQACFPSNQFLTFSCHVSESLSLGCVTPHLSMLSWLPPTFSFIQSSTWLTLVYTSGAQF